MLAGVHSIFPLPDITGHHGKDPISQKKLCQGEGTWTHEKNPAMAGQWGQLHDPAATRKMHKNSKGNQKDDKGNAHISPPLPGTCRKAPARIIWYPGRSWTLFTYLLCITRNTCFHQAHSGPERGSPGLENVRASTRGSTDTSPTPCSKFPPYPPIHRRVQTRCWGSHPAGFGSSPTNCVAIRVARRHPNDTRLK